MYPHSFLWHYLWLAPHAFQVVLAVFMVRRQLVREFPVFFIYTLFEIVGESTLFILDHAAAVSNLQYWYAHWVVSVISIGLRFAVMSEIFSSVFRRYTGLQGLGRIVFRWATVVLLLAAIVIAARAPEDGTLHLFSRVHVLDLAVDMMQGGLWLLLLCFSFYFGVSWRGFAYGVAFGFGVFSAVDLASETLRAWTGPEAGYAFDFVAMATYHCCVLVWLLYVFVPEPAPDVVKELPEHDLEQWNAELQRLLLK
jgi:hypothetical protein